jgi:hypothetical protein
LACPLCIVGIAARPCECGKVLADGGRLGRRRGAWLGSEGARASQAELDPNSFAFDAVFGDKPKSRLGRMGAEAWFDRRGADRFEVLEQSCRIADGEAISLLVFQDGEMLSEGYGYGGRSR